MTSLTHEETCRVEELFTLPELLETLDVDYEDLRDSTLQEIYYDRVGDILEILEDF